MCVFIYASYLKNNLKLDEGESSPYTWLTNIWHIIIKTHIHLFLSSVRWLLVGQCSAPTKRNEWMDQATIHAAAGRVVRKKYV